ncbi:uncharacterized protein LOC117176340 [Belonocnema kinseyi]|uniref:uncharacterized protein LOC117176340 n=1 Tax=Belonocnema kinseyi TaxID=2817044 RepID=UPI00143D2BA8|nr:uncharacterized protein LOC117176340 [Belonocnema kinseyi]
MDQSDSEDEYTTPSEIIAETESATDHSLLPKSRGKYMIAYNAFMKWREEKHIKSVSEKICIEYFSEKSKTVKPSSLWATYSMLKCTMNLNEKVDLGKYKELKTFLKKSSKGVWNKKSKIFTSHQVRRFLTEAPDEQFLAAKTILVFGISGACYTNELINITSKDIEKQGEIYLVRIPKAQNSAPRTFKIIGEFAKIVQKYVDLRPANTTSDRFFLNFQNNRCTNQVIGMNKFGKTPQKIAEYLGLDDAKLYTGHCFRRTSANLWVDEVADIEGLKGRGARESNTGPIIQEKVFTLNENLNGPQTFKRSNGSVEGFKKQYGTQSSRKEVDILSNNPSDTAEFSPILKAEIHSKYLKLDNIYNADESGILWRILMACTFPLHSEEKEALERKGSKDRVTALFCANASGSHRIPLLLIGKAETPTCLKNLITTNSRDQRFKNLDSLGVIYTHQASAWMDKSIFLLWYKDVFIPRVLGRQRKDGITGKVVLLLDNAPCHPSLDELNAVNENFEVVYLPPNVTASNQPMAQGLIGTTKKLYKKNLLRRLLISEKPEGAIRFLKELDLPDCFGMLSLAWDAVKSSTLQKAWKPLLSDSLLLARQETNIKLEKEKDPLSIDDAVETEFPTDLISLPHEICDQVSELLSGPDYSVQESREFLLKWFENDDNDNDCGWELSSDNDTAHFVTGGRLVSQIEIKMENSETMFEHPDMANFVALGRIAPEIEIKIENSETILENPESMEITSEVVTEILPKIEKSEIMCENSESMKETSSSEAFGCLMKFKNWAKSRADCLPKHLDCIKELENLAIERKVCQVKF